MPSKSRAVIRGTLHASSVGAQMSLQRYDSIDGDVAVDDRFRSALQDGQYLVRQLRAKTQHRRSYARAYARSNDVGRVDL